MKNKKKAFTLTELLVVVIVIGVLSAAVLPKFSKVIETRKTTEAEELMASIRTEQEKRCALDKPYLTDLSNMSEIVKKTDTKNYQLTLQDKGVIASSKGNYSYNLQMPSYADGRICCDGDDCAKLNKNYPSCQGFTYEPSPDSCAGTPPPPDPEPKSCAGTAVTERACTSGCGTEHRTATCNTATGNWEYSAWDNSCTAKPASESRECGTGYTGTQTRSAVCKDGVWDWSDWTGTCTAKTGCDGEKPADLVTTCGSACMVQNIPYICKEVTGGKWQWIPDGSQSSGCHLADGAKCSQPGQTKGDCFVYAPGKPQAGIAPTYMQEVCSSSCQWELQSCNSKPATPQCSGGYSYDADSGKCCRSIPSTESRSWAAGYAGGGCTKPDTSTISYPGLSRCTKSCPYEGACVSGINGVTAQFSSSGGKKTVSADKLVCQNNRWVYIENGTTYNLLDTMHVSALIQTCDTTCVDP